MSNLYMPARYWEISEDLYLDVRRSNSILRNSAFLYSLLNRPQHFCRYLTKMKKEMATHSSILAWRIPWTEEPGGLQSTGSQRVGHDWVNLLTYLLTYPNIEKNQVNRKNCFFHGSLWGKSTIKISGKSHTITFREI